MSIGLDFKSILQLLKGFIPVVISLIPILLIFGGIFLVIFCIKNKVHIKWKTFSKKGFRPNRGDFGLYVYCGSQGKGKTYSLIEYLLDHNKQIVCYSNINNIHGVDHIIYYQGFQGLIDIKHGLDNGSITIPKKKKLVIVFDEIFTELQRGDKLSKEVLDFLCQMRKRKITFLTTCQYWAELPISYRRFCRYEIDCNMIPILWTGILIKTFHDAEQMKWSNDDQDFIAPITETTVTKCRKIVANSYDTFLRISSIPPQQQERR